MARKTAEPSDTASRVLDVTERLVQGRGFNGFSYADAAAELGITKAALHYHFAGKAELGEALVTRYAERFAHALQAIDGGSTDAMERLRAYAELYGDVLRTERMCLCGMLAAEYQTLPAPMQDAVVRFFDDNETWLAAVLEDGRRAGTVRYAGDARDVARMIVGALEGAMLVARLHSDPRRFAEASDRLLASLATESAPGKS
jgi:TetR/AcrR family transcriptional repressor of nem operon